MTVKRETLRALAATARPGSPVLLSRNLTTRSPLPNSSPHRSTTPIQSVWSSCCAIHRAELTFSKSKRELRQVCWVIELKVRAADCFQKAAEQKKALDALKSWRHFDGLEKTRFEPIADQNLYDILLDDWNERGVEAYHRDDMAALDDQPVDGSVHADESRTPRVTKRARSGAAPKDQEALAPLFDLSPSKSSNADSSANDEDLFAPDPISPQLGSKRKLPAASSRTIARLIDPDDKGKYDLLKIAEKGGPGRVTFIFEKQSASKMMAEDEEAGEEAAA